MKESPLNMKTDEAPEAVAIIGMAGRFPKAKNLEEFWRNLRAGVNCVSFFKDDEAVQWLPIEHKPDVKDPRYVRARAILEKPEWFDAAFFGMNPQEARIMDPQHRVFLECAWEALEHAGCNPDTYPGMIGVFAGASMNSYLFTNLLTNPNLIADHGVFSTMIANDGDFVTTRVSYKLNLRGPSVNVQTACSTSLVAVCMAAQNLLSYRCDVALAGGVSITFPANRGQFHLEGGILSNDGHCRAFDAKALGTVLGDGVGIVVLKRLSEAIADGDNICAVIKGTAINNDGAVKIGYTAPSIDGQAEAIAMAHSEAGFDPKSVSYIEAHGTGTPLGDPIEIAGLTKAFGLGGEQGQFCAVGSVKSNIGHLDIGAGVAGLIKTVLALQHEEIPPSLHFESPNPKIDFKGSPFFVSSSLRPWQRNGAPRRAGVSSFGIGGTNSHVALEEAPAPVPTAPAKGPQLLILSAKSSTALDAVTDNLATYLEQNPSANLADVAYTLQVGRKTFAHRRAVVATTAAEAAAALRARDAKCSTTANSDVENAPVAFLFTGQGAQTIDMARGIYETDAGFRANVDRSCALLKARLGLDLREILFPQPERAEEATKLLNETRLTQPALFVIEHALALRWMGQGIVPTAMMGHSLGEYVAATLAGVFSLEDALALVAERARLMQAQPAGAMLAVRKPEAEVRGFLDNNLALAAVNAPGLCVVSGPFDDIGALEQRLAASAIASKRLVTSHAFHSQMMEGALRPLADFIRRLKLNAPKIPFVSNLTGTWITDADARNADYWTRHLRNTVRFADGVAEVVKGGARVLLEVGPGSTLAGLARQHPATAGGAASVAATLGHAKDLAADSAALLALGELWLGGAQIDWRTALHGEARRRIVALPTYPFERKRFVIEPGMAFAVGSGQGIRIEGSNPSLSAEVAVPDAAVRSNAHDTVAALRALFQELSGVDLATTSADTSFYELGFDSLFLTQASLAVGRKFGVEITFRQLRDSLQTLAKLAAHIDQSVAPARDNAAVEPTAATVPAPVAEKRLPLTAAQREIWFASQLGVAASSAYNEACILRLDGALDTDALQRGLHQLVARHESLRITFSPKGEEQIVAPHGRVQLPVHDLSSTEATRRDDGVRDVIAQELERPFDLVSGPLFRACLVRVESQRHVLTLVVHHTVSDGWSLGVIARELAELYAAEKGGRAPKLTLAPSFADYATRQAEMRQSSAYAAAEKFWREQFADTVPTLELPSDRPRPAQRTFAGDFVTRTLAPDLAAIVKQLCTRHECTTFTALLATFNVLLHRLSGQHDVVVGVPSAAQVMDGMENLVGHCANLLPIRSRLSQGERFTDYLIEVRRQLADAMEHWRYPFGALLQQLNLPRDANRVPLAPVAFNMTRRGDTFAFADLKTEVLGNPKKFVNFDLNFNFALSGDAITLGCYYSTELYDEATILRWFGHFETLLRGIAADATALVDELPILSKAERQQILVDWNDTTREYPRDRSIPELFQDQVARTPDATALVFGDRRLSYREVDERANQLAYRLRRAGVKRNTLVAVSMERSLELVVALVGIVKAGGAYVSLDPAYPAERLAFMLEDTQAPVLLTQEKFRATFARTEATIAEVIVLDPEWTVLATESRATSPVTLSAEDLAYVSYTSGSTGKPKGVGVPHRGVVRLVRNTNYAEFTAREVFLQFAPVAFDASTLEIWGALLNGARVVVFPPGPTSLRDLGAAIERHGVTTLWLTSGLFHQMVDEQIDSLRHVRQLLAGGDVLSIAHVRRVLERLPHLRLVNGYGPTENTTFTTCHAIVAPVALDRSIPIGRPIANTQVYILDEQLRPVPVGAPGELYAGGDGLARGYLNRDELTREKFVANPFSSDSTARLYRTGDRVRWLADGSIEFLGRRDNQIKWRGYRIELDEIENAVRQQSGVGECLVIVREDEPGDRRLVAYVVAEGVDGRGIRSGLKSRLPDYMLPSAVVVIGKFPLTPNGKVDRRALPRPDQEVESAAQANSAPRTETEELLAEIWADVLGMTRIGVDDNFFELGGHSLLATRVLVRVQDAFGIELTMQQFFSAPTVAGSALAIEEALIKEIKTAADEDAEHAASADLALAKE